MYYFEQAFRSSAESWRSLRASRAQPPGHASAGKRASTYRATLEQAEQQFRAAASIDYDSRALNLFYGLSQAGKAIIACSALVGNDEWDTNSHGLTSSRLQIERPSIAQIDVAIDDSLRGTFQTAARALGSPLPSTPVPLIEAWALLLETAYSAPFGRTEYGPLLADARPVPSGYQSPLVQVNLPPAVGGLAPGERPAFSAYFRRFPSLSGWLGEDEPGARGWPIDGSTGILLTYPLPTDPEDFAHPVTDRLTVYRGNYIAVSSTPAMPRPMHPLLTWWLVLFALSVSTRYEAAAWTKLINPNASPEASAIEFVLDTALDAVPDLVSESIQRFA